MKKWLYDVSKSVGTYLAVVALGAAAAAVMWGLATAAAVEANTAWRVANEDGFKQLKADLIFLKAVDGIALASDAGAAMTAAINIKGAAKRFRGEEIWVTNFSADAETRIKLKVEGTFRDDPIVLIELSREAARALKFAETQIEDEIQVLIEPVEPTP